MAPFLAATDSLDVFLTGNRVTLRVVNRPGVPQQLAEHVVEKVPKDFLFLMGIDEETEEMISAHFCNFGTN